MKNSYWEQTGKHQKEYNELYKKLVPYSGKAETEIGEILRISSKFYYDLYNNGCANVSNHKEDYKKLVDYCLEHLDNEIVDDDGLHFIQDIIDADDGFSYEELEDNNFDIEELVEDFENDINKQEALENLVDQIIVHVNENYLIEKEKDIEKVRNQSEPGVTFTTIKKYKDDFDVVLECVKQDGMFLDFASDELRNNKEICLAAIKNHKAAFTFFSNELRDDKEFLIECAKHNGYILEIMDDNYKDDYDIVMAAVKNDGHTLEFASDRLANNKEIVREAIYSDNDSLQFASSELLNDKNFMLECVNLYGMNLKYASLELLKNDVDLVFTAIKQNEEVMNYVSSDELNKRYNDFLKDKKELLNELETNQYKDKLLGIESSLHFSSFDIKNDKEIALKSVEKNGDYLKHFSNNIRNDIGVALAAIKQNGHSLKYVSDELKDNEKLVSMALEQQDWYLQFASPRLQELNKNIPLNTFKIEDQIYTKEELIGKTIKVDSEVADVSCEATIVDIRKDVDDESNYFFEIDNLKNIIGNKELLKNSDGGYSINFFEVASVVKEEQILNKNSLGYEIKYTNKDELFFINSNNNILNNLQYTSDELRADKEFMLECVKLVPYSLQYASDALKNDFDVVMTAVKQNGPSIEHASNELQNDRDIVMEAVKQYGRLLDCVNEDFIKNNKDILLMAVKNDDIIMEYVISDELKDKYGHNSNDFIKNLEAELNPKNIISLDDSLDDILKKLEEIKQVKLEVVKPSSNSNTSNSNISSNDVSDIKKKSNNHRQ